MAFPAAPAVVPPGRDKRNAGDDNVFGNRST